MAIMSLPATHLIMSFTSSRSRLLGVFDKRDCAGREDSLSLASTLKEVCNQPTTK
jgi:hypothetical protein